MPKGERLLNRKEQDDLIEHISNGGAASTWCKERGMANSKVYLTLREDNEFKADYSHARENQADSFVEKIFDVCNKLELRTIDPHSARVIIDTLKWTAGKLKPKQWSDSMEVNVKVSGKLSMIDYLIQQQQGKAIEADFTEQESIRELSEDARERLITAQGDSTPTPTLPRASETPPGAI